MRRGWHSGDGAGRGLAPGLPGLREKLPCPHTSPCSSEAQGAPGCSPAKCGASPPESDAEADSIALFPAAGRQPASAPIREPVALAPLPGIWPRNLFLCTLSPPAASFPLFSCVFFKSGSMAAATTTTINSVVAKPFGRNRSKQRVFAEGALPTGTLHHQRRC